MRKLALAVVLSLITSSAFAASSECTKMLGSLVHHAKEGQRLNSAAISHGFNIYTGEVENIDDQSKYAKDYLRLSNQHLEKAEVLEEKLKQDCLK